MLPVSVPKTVVKVTLETMPTTNVPHVSATVRLAPTVLNVPFAKSTLP